MCSCVWLLFGMGNIADNIIWDPTSGIKAKIWDSVAELGSNLNGDKNYIWQEYLYTCKRTSTSNIWDQFAK